jgi:hypothetical protein
MLKIVSETEIAAVAVDYNWAVDYYWYNALTIA